MRNTQLDSSVPRTPGRRDLNLPGAAGPPVAFRYLPPILMTGAAALVLALVFGMFALLFSGITLGLLNPPADTPPPSIVATAGCGLLSLLICAATVYFVVAGITAGRDLGAAPVRLTGRVRGKHTGRGRGGGHWIIVGPYTAPDPQSLAADAPSLASAAGADALPATRVPAERGFARNQGAGFGAQLQGAQVGVAPATPEVPLSLALPNERRRLAPDEVNLRVDKPTYEALAAGDRIDVVYSRYLQHVYYVVRTTDGGPLVLRNRALI